jgi:hypothetical protein
MKMMWFTLLRLPMKISHQLHVWGNLACHFQFDYKHGILTKKTKLNSVA